MAFHKLDNNGKPLPNKGKGRASRIPAEREENGKSLFHYEITTAVPLEGGKCRQIRRRYWLHNDTEAEAKYRELKHKAPIQALTWEEAYNRWIDGNKSGFSRGHIRNTITTMNQWFGAFGATKAIEATTLPEFSGWIESRAKKGTGRAAQIKFGHLMAIARWCRERGYITSIPFEHSPKPTANLKERPPATPAEYLALLKFLPESVQMIWEILGLTGMRLGAACSLLEKDIGDREFTVTTKGKKRVTYPITPEIAKIFSRARNWKTAKGFKATETIFCNLAGNPWTSVTIGSRIRNAGKKEGAPRITAHQLRHMAGTIMAKKNLARDIIQAGLGHDDSSSTERYVDHDLEMRKTAVQAVARFLQENNTKNAKSRSITVELNAAKSSHRKTTKCPYCDHNILISINIKPQPK